MDSLEKYRLRSFCNSVINENYHRLSMWGLTVINPAKHAGLLGWSHKSWAGRMRPGTDFDIPTRK